MSTNGRGRIAVVGMACRFPGARNLSEFWNNLRRGLEADLSIDLKEWADTIDLPLPLMDRPGVVAARPRIEDIELFDAAFFGYTPREAQALDPQQRLFLECAWEALENAGYDSERYEGRIGVTAGVSQSSYLLNLLQWDRELVESMGTLNVGIGNMNDSLATRVAYKLNLRGPAYAVQCFCSTSLVAIHLACQSLRSGESDMALAGGVTVSVPQNTGYLYQEGGILSPDGHTRTFDARGQGMAFGSGLGVVVLKRLEDALAEHDTIHAVVLGSAINNDGSLKVGYTAPSVSGQARVIEEALEATGVHPETIRYIEAHGTATSLGDPAEIAGLTKAFRRWTDKSSYCAIGSVKTNIGHLDAAAGVAGFIKAVLALENEEIPASLHLESPNPEIEFEGSPFYVSTRLEPWESTNGARRAGVSSFGFGGTNAHAILEEAPSRPPSDPARPFQLLLLSAKTETSLDRAAENLAAFLTENPQVNLADVAYTLQVGRHVFNQRRAVVARDVDDARQALSDRARWESTRQDRQHAPVVFLFTGQGSQYVDMAKGLYREEPAFRDAIDECCRILSDRAGLELLPLLYPEGGDLEAASDRLKDTEVAQPALFAIEYAMTRLLASWGIEPQAMIGHSIGEYVAAHLAGVFSLEDALALVAERGRLMQSLPPGAMLAVPLSEEAVAPYLGPDVDLASANAPSASVLAGPIEAIDRVERELSERSVMSRRLHTSHAFHSAMMDPILLPFEEKLRAIEMRPPRVPFVSNVTGRWIEAERAMAPDYWSRHLRSSVRFYQGLQTLLEEGSPILVEVGPGNTLASLARQLPREGEAPSVVATIRHPKEGREDRAFFLSAMGRLWLSGAHLDWRRVHEGERRRRIPLPTYPFQRERFWVERNEQMQRAREIATGVTFRRQKLEDWFFQVSWQRFLPPEMAADPVLSEKNLWLVFEDELGAAAGFEEELRSRGQKTVRLRAGEGFSGDEASGFVIRPGERGDYLALVQAVLARAGAPTHVAHFWSMTPASDAREIEDRVSGSQERGFRSLLFFAQALARADVKSPLQLLVVTNGLHDVVGSERLRPEKATMIGPCRVIPQELRNVGCSLIDVDSLEPGAGMPEHQMRWLLGELLAAEQEGARGLRIAAYRSSHRWIVTSLPMKLHEPSRPRIRENGVYLITGGAGGIGLALAEHLARKYRAKLVLTGRTPLPPREKWTESDPRCEKLLFLEKLGAEVLYVAADVARSEDMREAVRQARERFGPLNGVVHSAGVPGGGIIPLKEPAEVERVMSPKLQGTLSLARAIASEPLDFLVLCSSTAAWIGGVGQVDYCGANAFLDAYAASREREGGPYTVSINWDTWKEVGMAVKTEVTGAMKAVRDLNLKLGIGPEEGASAFERILGSGISEVATFTVDLMPRLLHARIAATLPRPKKDENARAEVESGSSEAGGDPDLEAGASSDLEVVIQGVWTKVLGRKPIGVNDNFFELGGDSLTALQAISLLKGRIGRDVPIVTFYEAPTIALLAKALAPKEVDEEREVEESLADVGARAETRLQLMRDRRRRGRSGPAVMED